MINIKVSGFFQVLIAAVVFNFAIVSAYNFNFTVSVKTAGERVSFPLIDAKGVWVRWGDDTPADRINGSKFASHAYSKTGDYTVRLRGVRAFSDIDPRAMILEIDTKLITYMDNLELPFKPLILADKTQAKFSVNWGDGTINSELDHKYAEKKPYKVTILGTFAGILLPPQQLGMGATMAHFIGLTKVLSFGSLGIKNWSYVFNHAENLVGVPTIFEGATNLKEMFVGASKFNSDIGGWNTSLVTNMSFMFIGATSFNQNIGKWETGKVTNMSHMFFGAESFNQDIGKWETGKVTNMDSMFYVAESFNQNLGSWKTNKKLTMVNMFEGATKFKGTLPGSNKK